MKLTVPDQHKLKIAIKTLQMVCDIPFLGGPSKQEARQILSEFGYTREMINKIEECKPAFPGGRR